MSKATRKNIEAIYPLSPTQQGMLFHSLYDRESGVYVEQLAATLRGDLDVNAFSQAWQRVVDRHAVLRTAFAWKRLEQMMQVVRQRVTVPIVQEDWRHYPAEEQEKRLDAWLEAERRRGFDLAKAPLMRLALMRISDQAHYFVWSHHHALLDGWSLPLVLQEVFVLYEAFRLGQDVRLPPVRPYREYIEWLAQQDEEAAESFWREQLRGFSAPTSLVVERAPEQTSPQQMQYGKEEAKLSAEDTRQLHDMARSYGITLSTLLQGAWALLLSRYNDQADVLFGATVSGRPAELPGVERMVGLFINTIPVRVQVDEQEKVGAWLQAHQRRAFAARQFEHAPLALIQQWSDVPAGTPLFQSILVFENYPQDEAAQARQGSVSIEDVHSVEYSNYPLAVVSAPATELTLRIRYDRSRFDDAVIARMVQHLANLLLGMISQPEQPLAGVSMLSEAERTQIVEQWNDTDVDAPSSTVVEQFEQQVQRTPSAPAFVFGQEQWTYATLNQRANQLAWHLRELGVGPETPVGILMERSPEMVLAVLAVLKAGGAYLPLDPAYPPDRIRYMIEDAGAQVLLVEGRTEAGEQRSEIRGQRSEVGESPIPNIQYLRLDDPAINAQPTTNPDLAIASDHLAYILYTSGSTGKPKGVMVERASLANYLNWVNEMLYGEAVQVMPWVTKLSFDASLKQFLAPLLVGRAVWGMAETVVADPVGLLQALRSRSRIGFNSVPSLWQAMLDAIEVDPTLSPGSNLTQVLLGGEALNAELVSLTQAILPDAAIRNVYGPTEGTANASIAAVAKPSAIDIGRPLANTRMYVLDRHLRPLPVGAPGELFIGGVAVTRGYWRRPARTAASFLPDPFASEPGARLYRTGDLVRYKADGRIEFLGRIDDQVKLSGYRIELGEIEAVLQQHEAVKEAVVVLRDFGREEEEAGREDKRLVAYFTDHPALIGWEPLPGFGRLSSATTADATRRWLDEVIEVLGQSAPRQQIAFLVAFDAMENADSIGLDTIIEAGGRPGLSLATFASDRRHLPLSIRWTSFAVELAVALAGEPVSLYLAGLPTVGPGERSVARDGVFYASEEDAAEHLAQVIALARQAQLPSLWLWRWADISEDLWLAPPYDRPNWRRYTGLIRADGNDKKLVQALTATTSVPEFTRLDVDLDAYRQDPYQYLNALWKEFSR
jgi:amino acid adenylation domain-containing protein